MKGARTVRVVLVERHVVFPGEVFAYARAAWGDSRRAEFKAWLAGPGVINGASPHLAMKGLHSRSRSLASCRDPMLAQEWAWEQWDEYLADIKNACDDHYARTR